MDEDEYNEGFDRGVLQGDHERQALKAEVERLKRDLAEQKESHNDTILGRVVAREVAKVCFARIRPRNIPDMPKGAYDEWCNALLQRHPWLEEK